MEKTWLRYLEVLNLSCFVDRGQMRYAVEDRRAGKIFLTTAPVASALTLCRRRLQGETDQEVPEDTLRTVYGFLRNLRAMGQREADRKKPFNPLFARWHLFELGRFARPMSRAADLLAPLVLPAFLALVLAALWIGFQSDWRILANANSAISFAGLATFAVLSPFLKIPHELGHALTARRFNVDLGAFGILFVGLFPLPFVDCTRADVQANRHQRILISAAGVLVDLFIALIAFIAWHYVEGSFLSTILLNVFVFNTLNSLLFNGNPLIKLDGYYVFTDLIGHRNLTVAATKVFKPFKRYVTTLGREGALPEGRRERLYTAYGAGSALYKINILISVCWIVLPKFFGLGLLLLVWGGYAMLVSPLFAERRVATGDATPGTRRATLPFWSGVAAVLGLVLLIPLPISVVIPAALDTSNRYGVFAIEPGLVIETAPGPARAGDQIARLNSLILQEDLVMAEQELAAVRTGLSSATGADQTEARAFAEQVARFEAEIASLSARRAGLQLRATADGVFVPSPSLSTGAFVQEGAAIGYFLPEADRAAVVADFPERRVDRFDAGTARVEAWIAGAPQGPYAETELRLVQETGIEPESGMRSFTLEATLPLPPQDLHGRDLYLKVAMGRAPAYVHVWGWLLQLRQNYRNARLDQMR